MNGVIQAIFLVYFITHIPITLFVDAQAFLGQYYPPSLQQLIVFYVDTFKDTLMAYPPAWFQSFILAELLFQLPFFFVASYALYYRKNWIRIPSIIYGTHVATTVWAILMETLMNTTNSQSEKTQLLANSPYILPAC